MNKIKKTGQGKLFESAFLELFTRTNPLIHVITYGGAVTCYVWLNSDGIKPFLIYFILGALAWTLTEYLVHRYLFHMKPGRFQYLIHGVHHEYPRDRERLMMPPVPGIVLLSLFTAFWSVLVGPHFPAFMAGFTVGYVAYTFIHYIIHAWKPIPGIKFLWAHHLKHHNPATEDKAYGVSSPFWDMIFGTLPGKSNR